VATPAVFENGLRIGYDFIDLRQGTRQPLARIVDSPDETPTIGPYRFVEAAVIAGNRAIIAGVRGGLDIVTIDEVGPLEFRGGGWAPAFQVALAEMRQPKELVIVVRPALVAELSKLLNRTLKPPFELIEIPDADTSASALGSGVDS